MPVRKPAGYVFATSTGKPQQAGNVRNRVRCPAVQHVNAARVKEGLPLPPEGLTPHSLRRSFVSLLVALGEQPL